MQSPIQKFYNSNHLQNSNEAKDEIATRHTSENTLIYEVFCNTTIWKISLKTRLKFSFYDLFSYKTP